MGAVAITQQFRAVTVLTKDPGSIPGISWWLTTTCNSSAKDLHLLAAEGTMQAPGVHKGKHIN